MQYLGLNELREKFLSFFEYKEHLRLKSFPLVPQNDKSLLLINSGMAPLKSFFTGQEIPPNKRVTTCQKCIRTGDIENVGKTARHGTFFEMLGNFSFGDYFKKEIISWAWEFVTNVLEIPLDRLYVSVYKEDDESFKIWNEQIGIPKEKIFKMDKDDNFWEVGIGPCGPCSEIYFDRGEKYGCGEDDCTVGCDCDRYIEFWNLVFTQFNKHEDGSYSDLEHPNIDTGMGLERIAAIMQDVYSIFDVDTIKAIRDEVCCIADVKYNIDGKKDQSIRVITDHIRSITFMTGDGILPSNEGRGYVLRRLLRRAIRHGKLLGINTMFLTRLCEIVIDVSKDAYPELIDKKDYILKVISVEERKFYDTLEQGMDILNSFIDNLKNLGEYLLKGSEIFKLYDTYGFPVDLTKEIVEELGFSLDMDSFNSEMEIQRNRARAAREESTYMGRNDTVYDRLDNNINSVFVGYKDVCSVDSKILSIICNNEIVGIANKGDAVSIIVDKTPFYAESGGQAADIGVLKTDTGVVEINNCIKAGANKTAHVGTVTEGFISLSNCASLFISVDNRLSIARNHSATHLLQKALREIIGNHVEQSGSLVNSTKLRFDFTHFSPLSDNELEAVENIVNSKILEALPISINEMNIEEARKLGAMALFGEKYTDIVRVVNMSEFSIELCGGTHLPNTAQIGSFKIISESGIASGVRRIEAVTGNAALEFYRQQNNFINTICNVFKTNPENLLKRIETIMSENKQFIKTIEDLKSKVADKNIEGILESQISIDGFNAIITKVSNYDMDSLRSLGDKLKEKIKSGVIVLVSDVNGKVNIVSMATKDAVGAGIHSGNIIKKIAAIVGGGGGGRPDMAQAGGKDVSKINDALNLARKIAEEQIAINLTQKD